VTVEYAGGSYTEQVTVEEAQTTVLDIVIAGGMAVEPALSPATIELLNAWPNPFNASLSVSFSTATSGWVMAGLYDISGRPAATITDGFVSSGEHRYLVNAVGLTNGLYFLKVQTSAGTSTRAVQLLK